MSYVNIVLYYYILIVIYTIMISDGKYLFIKYLGNSGLKINKLKHLYL